MITLHNGDKEIDIEVKDESYSYEAIMGEYTLTLYFSHPGYIEIRLAPGVTSTGSVIL